MVRQELNVLSLTYHIMVGIVDVYNDCYLQNEVMKQFKTGADMAKEMGLSPEVPATFAEILRDVEKGIAA